MKHKSSIAILVGAAVLTAAGSLAAQPARAVKKPAGVAAQKPNKFKSITRAEIEMLLAGVAESNPKVLQRLVEDPETKKGEIESLRQLLSFALEAEREGLAATPLNKQELENIRAEVTAVNYDRELNKGKKDVPPFSAIGDDRVAQFWARDTAAREAGFKAFLDSKVTLLKANDATKDHEVSGEETEQAREIYAKTQIYEKEYNGKAAAGTLPKSLRDKVALQVKLQQAQFLARTYAELLASKTSVSDQEISTYISTHPEFDSGGAKIKAEKILQRARAGEDFAKLANEFSEDPGNHGADGVSQGGLYKDVPKGMMIPAFEQAALALKPGEVAGGVVETDFGYHIIKLERAPGVAPAAETYDVRHILIGTMYQDPANPSGRPVPFVTYVRSKLSDEKETQMIDEIIARSNVSVPDDFTVPGTAPAKAPAAKSSPVKKTAPASRPKRTARKK